MRRKKRVLWLIPVSIVSLVTLGYLIYTYPPNTTFLIVPSLVVFLFLLFVFVFTFFSFLLQNSRRAFFITLFLEIFLVLRLVNLTHPFFAGLLIFIFIALELVFRRKPDKIRKP